MRNDDYITTATLLQDRVLYGLDSPNQIVKPCLDILWALTALAPISPNIPFLFLIQAPFFPQRPDLFGQFAFIVAVIPLPNVLCPLDFGSARAAFLDKYLPRPARPL